MLRHFVVISSSAVVLIALGCGSSSDQQSSDQTHGDATTSTTGTASGGKSATGGGGASSSTGTSAAGGAGGMTHTGGGGSGGEGAGGSGGFHPGPHAAAPQVVSLGGKTLATPKLQIISYDADQYEADVDKFANQLAASTFWAATTSEYQVGPLTVLPPVHIATAPDPKMSDSSVKTMLVNNTTGANPAWGPADPSTIYMFVIPQSSTFSGGGKCCNDYDGYHDEAQVSNTASVPYGIVCTCPGFDGPNITDLQGLTVALSHEIIEAATDPYVETGLAFSQADDPHAAWTIVTSGEVGDMCEYDLDQYYTPKDMTYVVQRTWSNKAAAAGQDPCVPQLDAPNVYFNSVPVENDTVTVNVFGSPVKTKGTTIPLGQSKTIDVQLFSVAPTTGPWKLTAYDFSSVFGGKPSLQFSWDSEMGQNGDTRKLTITVLAKDQMDGGEPYVIESDLGDESNLWIGVVGN